MIIAYTGMPGGGKTTALAHRAMQALKQGREVFSNVNIKGTFKIQFEDLLTYRFPEGSVVLIDESGRWFNSRKWASLPEDVFDMFTMHRHLQLDLYIAVQSFARIDKSLREVVELVYWSRNSPFLPFHKYEGFYDLEKVGSMKGDYNVSHVVWKSRKVRGMFNTHSMKNQFAHKEEIPRIEWNDFRHSNKKLHQRIKQLVRINYKVLKRNMNLHKLQWRKAPTETLEEIERRLLLRYQNDKKIRVSKYKPELIEAVRKRGILYKSPEIWVSCQSIIRAAKEKQQQKFLDEWAESNSSLSFGFELKEKTPS